MKKTKQLSILIFLFLFLIPCISKGVLFGKDSVYLYENGKRIDDDAAIFESYLVNSTRCKNGLCLIGQQFYPVTIYRTENDNTLTYHEFSSQHPYEGNRYDGKAKRTWNAQNTENYLKYLEENSNYFISFDPGPSEGGEGAPFIPFKHGQSEGMYMPGGRIGDDRSYVLNINNGDYKQISGQPYEIFIFNENEEIICLLSLIGLVLITYLGLPH